MLNLMARIFGTGKVLEKSLDVIDALHTSDEEKMNARVALLEAYRPFKLAQRIIALSFTAGDLMCFALTLGFTLFGRTAEVELVNTTLAHYEINNAVLIILLFYFSGGALEGIAARLKDKAKK